MKPGIHPASLPLGHNETVAKHRKPRRNRGGRGSKSFDRLTTPSKVEGPQEYYLYFEDFETKPDNEFGRKLKFCNGLKVAF